jgi:hypothetical protein
MGEFKTVLTIEQISFLSDTKAEPPRSVSIARRRRLDLSAIDVIMIKAEDEDEKRTQTRVEWSIRRLDLG